VRIQGITGRSPAATRNACASSLRAWRERSTGPFACRHGSGKDGGKQGESDAGKRRSERTKKETTLLKRRQGDAREEQRSHCPLRDSCRKAPAILTLEHSHRILRGAARPLRPMGPKK
jgi:hypothetical protein